MNAAFAVIYCVLHDVFKVVIFVRALLSFNYFINSKPLINRAKTRPNPTIIILTLTKAIKPFRIFPQTPLLSILLMMLN